jgi:2,5-diketo-D-gluconate reductase A
MSIPSSSESTLAMFMVGFGTYQLPIEQTEQAVAEALTAGFHPVDSAQGYNNEAGTGKALAASGSPREELFVTTRVFPGYAGWGVPDKGFDETIQACKTSLEELPLDYVDLYMIHIPAPKRLKI